jgi:hypothetical protein
VKTTLDLPDELFREVKSTAAKRGVLMKEFITEALREKLGSSSQMAPERPWMKFAGCMANDPEMKTELRRIDKIIQDEFGQVDPEDWK